MLSLTIPQREYYDDLKQEFVYLKEQRIVVEHSLISISKWESKWKKPFLSREPKTKVETDDYIRCMTLTPNVDPAIYAGFTRELYKKIEGYIDDTMTATWFNDNHRNSRGGKGQVITSELIYYWMVAYNIPFECEKWHLNRLLTLIRICEIKNAPDKKMKRKEIYSRNRALNAARKKNLGTNG